MLIKYCYLCKYCYHYFTMFAVMEEKYYAPTLDEFFVTFEYEFWGSTVGGFDVLDINNPSDVSNRIEPSIQVWSKEVVNINPFYSRTLQSISELISSKQIRVKRLDKEDIESLGFIAEVVECGEDTEHDTFGIRLKNSTVGYDGAGYIGNFYSLNNPDKEENLEIFNSFYMIKNKAEFKKLIKQLNIL